MTIFNVDIKLFLIIILLAHNCLAQEAIDDSCSDFINKISSCQEYTCNGKSILNNGQTQVKRSISLSDEEADKCIYQEEFFGLESEQFESTVCELDLNELINLKNTEEVNNIIEQLCNVTNDNNQDNVIENIQKEAQITNNSEQKPNFVADTKIYQWNGSLMFDRSSIKMLEQAVGGDQELLDALVSTTKSNIQGVISDAVDGVSPEEKPITAADVPDFYLNSIIFDDVNNWSIWLNGVKITKSLNTTDTIINKITEDYVTFEYVVNDFDKYTPAWKSNLEKTSDIIYESKNKNIIAEINSKKLGNKMIHFGRVKFILEPNQNFDLFNMSITEGKP